MNAINFTELRKKLKNYMDQVYDNHEPLIVTRKNNQNIVLLSVEDYNSLIETDYLLSNPANAKRLQRSLGKSRSGKTFTRELIVK
jgi:antitoxin YefM